MPDSGRERYRRAGLRLPDYRRASTGRDPSTGTATPGTRAERTGHAMMFRVSEVVDFGLFEDGGGFPNGFLEFACRTLGCDQPDQVLHVCSGSVRTPFTIDVRPDVRPAGARGFCPSCAGPILAVL